jgi:protein-S-isoprenylcysteine O-methyltransferase Ste14
MTKDEEELKVVYSALDDQRRLIAAGKVQRWDVVKWAVTVNVALATAATLIQFKGAFDVCGLAVPFSFVPSLLAIAVFFVSLVLVLWAPRTIPVRRVMATKRIDSL